MCARACVSSPSISLTPPPPHTHTKYQNMLQLPHYKNKFLVRDQIYFLRMSLILKGTTHSFSNCLPLEMYQNTMLYVGYCAVCLCVYVSICESLFAFTYVTLSFFVFVSLSFYSYIYEREKCFI